MKRTIACFCEKTFEAEIPDAVDLSANPEVERQIESGEFMAVTCPSCAKRLTPEYPCRVSGLKGGRELYFIPEKDRAAYKRGKLDYGIGNPARVVIGFPELVEKIRIFGEGLDDRVVEIMKFYLLTGSRPDADGRDEPEDGADIVLRYAGEAGGSCQFHIEGLKKGEVGVARLSREMYRKIAEDIEARVAQEPFRQFCEPPHVSLRRLE